MTLPVRKGSPPPPPGTNSARTEVDGRARHRRARVNPPSRESRLGQRNKPKLELVWRVVPTGRAGMLDGWCVGRPGAGCGGRRLPGPPLPKAGGEERPRRAVAHRPALADDVGRLDDDMAHVRLQIRPAQSRASHFLISSPIPFPSIPSRPPSRPLTHSIHPLCPPEQASSTRSRVRSGPSVPLSCSPDRSRHSRASDLIRHGKNHHSARQQDDAAYQSTYAQSQIQQQQQQAQQQQRTERSRHREPHDGQSQARKQGDSSKYRDHVEQIVQEEREAKGKMPVYKGLENYKLLEKMGE